MTTTLRDDSLELLGNVNAAQLASREQGSGLRIEWLTKLVTFQE